MQQGGKVVVEVPGQHQVVPGQDEQQEPIYQNQVAYYHNQTEDENGEPIYQNLPAHQNQGRSTFIFKYIYFLASGLMRGSQ